jgi:hypothetical protein
MFGAVCASQITHFALGVRHAVSVGVQTACAAVALAVAVLLALYQVPPVQAAMQAAAGEGLSSVVGLVVLAPAQRLPVLAAVLLYAFSAHVGPLAASQVCVMVLPIVVFCLTRSQIPSQWPRLSSVWIVLIALLAAPGPLLVGYAAFGAGVAQISIPGVAFFILGMSTGGGILPPAQTHENQAWRLPSTGHCGAGAVLCRSCWHWAAGPPCWWCRHRG